MDLSVTSLARYEQKWRAALGPVYRKKAFSSALIHHTNRMGFYRIPPWVRLLGLGWN